MPDVVITGASSGIGFAACEALIRRGFRVFGSVRTKPDADRLTEQLGPQYVPLIFDVTDADSVNWDTSQHGTASPQESNGDCRGAILHASRPIEQFAYYRSWSSGI